MLGVVHSFFRLLTRLLFYLLLLLYLLSVVELAFGGKTGTFVEVLSATSRHILAIKQIQIAEYGLSRIAIQFSLFLKQNNILFVILTLFKTISLFL